VKDLEVLKFSFCQYLWSLSRNIFIISSLAFKYELRGCQIYVNFLFVCFGLLDWVRLVEDNLSRLYANMANMKYNLVEGNSSTHLWGITSLPQNKESVLKIIINKYVTKLELNCCKKSFLSWGSDGLEGTSSHQLCNHASPAPLLKQG
jgi:hypothetical protein